ncbi:MAG TPA: PTS sugar transporter subunit IIA [Melioribacteraceae bacterium]|nr:PTS sugar transporter subunit IIA [Melioribacteraceae bacterium]
MKITDVLKIESIIPELEGKTKTDIINELIDCLKGDNRVDDIEELRRAVFDREKVIPTGVGRGIAIPHAKTDAVTDTIMVFGKSSKPIDYSSNDGEPVNLFFLLVNKENSVSPHIKLLSRISRILLKEDFKDDLIEAKTAESIYNLFVVEDGKYIEI